MLSPQEDISEKVPAHRCGCGDLDEAALVRRARQLAEEVEEVAEAGGTASQEGDRLHR